MSKENSNLKIALSARSKERRSGLREKRRVSRSRPSRNDVLPKVTLETRKLAELRLPKRRPRKLTEAHIGEVRDAVAALGFCVPIIVSPDGEVIDGAARFEAARQLGLDQVPCVITAHLDTDELRLLRYAVNRLGEKGSWDLDVMRLEFDELIALDFDLEIAGFEPQEVDIILVDEVGDTASEEPVGDLTDKPSSPVTRLGDVWRLGDHIVACGDARDKKLLAELMNENARLILSDPPFNVPIKGHVSGLGKKVHAEFAMASGEMTDMEFEAFLRQSIEAAADHLMDGGLALLFMDWRGIETLLRAGREEGLNLLNIIVWAKSNGGMGSLWRSAHELIAAFKKGSASHLNNVELGAHGRWRSNVWEYPGATSQGSDARAGLQMHPTVKPVALLEDALLDITARGEIVLDTFLGSGSTLIAAENVGRRCRGVELDPAYMDVILQRWLDRVGSAPILIETGETIDVVRERRLEGATSAAEEPACQAPAPPNEHSKSVQ